MTQGNTPIRGLFGTAMAADFIKVIKQYPQENTKERILEQYVQTGGNCVNAAFVFSAMGGQAQWAGCMGSSPHKDHLMGDFDRFGVAVLDCAPEGYQTPVSDVMLNIANGNRTLFTSPKKDREDAVIPPVEDIQDFDFLMIDGFFPNLTEHLIDLAKERGKPVIMDADKWRNHDYMGFMHKVDYVIASEDFRPPGCKTQQDVLDLLQAINVPHIAITRGDKPILAIDNGEVKKIPVQQVEAVDTLGAGDIFHGAFGFYIIESHGDFLQSLQLASVVAGESCKHQGHGWMLEMKEGLEEEAALAQEADISPTEQDQPNPQG